jgi:hypothetical protein
MPGNADYYKTLQVDSEAEAEIIVVAYKRLASKYHPDVNPAPDAERRMRALNAAYEVLSNPGKRADYDARRQKARGRGRRAAGSAASNGAKAKGAKAAEAILVVSPRSLLFGRVLKGAAPTLRLDVGVTEGRTLIGEVRTTEPWIHLSVNRLFSDRTAVQVTVDTGLLDEGRHYTGAVVVDSVVFGTRQVPVSLSVAVSAKPQLLVRPSMLDFGEMRFGQPPKVIGLIVSNAGTGVLSGTLRPLQGWLGVTQSTIAGNADSVQVMASCDGLVAGRVYTGEIEVATNGGKTVIAAKLTVADEHPADARRPRVPSRDLLYLRERLALLDGQAELSAQQKQERGIIEYLLRTCRGGDVADMLQKGMAAAQGAEEISWRDAGGILRGTSQAATLLGDLLERLRRWENTER